MNSKHCVLLGLASWLEYFFEQGYDKQTEFAFGSDGEDCPIRINARAANLLRTILGSEQFGELLAEAEREGSKKGTHSIRKYGASMCAKAGIANHMIKHCFCWKQKRQSDTYIDLNLEWPDAKCAAALCVGGCICYHLKEEAHLSEDWILKHVTPNIHRVLGKKVALILGQALLWRIFDPEQSKVLPTKWVSQICKIYGNRTNNELNDDENPVARVQLHVDGNNGQLYVMPLFPFPEEDDEDITMGTTTPRTLFSNSSSNPDSGITCDDTPNRKR